MTIRWLVAFLATVGVLTAETVAAQTAIHDLVLRGGKIVDGTGNPWYLGDVAIAGDRIAAVSPKLPPGSGRREIDVAGLVVAPGFVDMHSHSDWTLLEDGDAQSKIRQGVTTEVLGESSSGGPNTGKLPAKKISLRGRTVDIVTLGDYFDAVVESGISVNIASYVGIGNVWRCVMGDSFERPTEQQLAQMKQLIAQAMRDGAMGLSSQLMSPPGALARTDEVVTLCEPVRQFGGIYSSHIRSEGTDVFAAITEAITIGERARVPVDIMHLKIADQQLWGRMPGIVSTIEQARTRGVNVQANVYPYTRGNNNLASIIPPWAHEGGREQMLGRLKDPEARQRLKRDIEQGIMGWYNHYTAVGKDWRRMLVSDQGPYAGMTVDQIIQDRSKGVSPPPDPLDILFDILIEQGGSISTVYAHHTEEDMNLALVQPWCSIGSDGSALAVEGPLRRGNPHPRNFGTFPRVLGVYVREQKLLRLEDAVRKMTSLSAAKIGLLDRGLLRAGCFADVTVFDPQTVGDKATYSDPFHYNTGIEYVIVNGQIVLEGQTHTGARPGRVLRRNAVSEPAQNQQ